MAARETRRYRNGEGARWPALLVAVCVLGAWELASRVGWIRPLFFPPPSRAVASLYRMAVTGALWPSLGATLSRLLLGVLLGAGAGAAIGWIMGALRPVRLALDPLVAVLHPLPKLALFPLFLVVLGIGESSKIALVALAAFFPMLLSVMAGVMQIGRLYLEVASSCGASGLLTLRRVILPGSLPMLITGLRLALNTGLVVAIAVEMLSAQRGLGAAVWFAWQTMRTHELYAILLVVGALGLGVNWLLGVLAARLVPWQMNGAP